MTTTERTEIIMAGIRDIAKNLNTTEERALNEIFWIQQTIYDKEDIAVFLCDEDIPFEEGDIDIIAQTLRDKWDCDVGTWENIRRGINASKNHLSANFKEIDI